MQAIILAGGKGLRLRGLVKDIPKPMAPVGGRPFLEYLVLQLIRWGVEEVILSIGHRRDLIRAHFLGGGRWKTRIRYAEEKEPLGTGGALREALPLIRESPFLLLNGDSFLDLDFAAFLAFHLRGGRLGTMALVPRPDTSRYGRVEVGEGGRVVAFREKQPGGPGLINGGIYLFHGEVRQYIPAVPSMVSLESVVLPALVGVGMGGFVTETFFVDIGLPEDYLALCAEPGPLRALAGSA